MIGASVNEPAAVIEHVGLWGDQVQLHDLFDQAGILADQFDHHFFQDALIGRIAAQGAETLEHDRVVVGRFDDAVGGFHSLFPV